MQWSAGSAAGRAQRYENPSAANRFPARIQARSSGSIIQPYFPLFGRFRAIAVQLPVYRRVSEIFLFSVVMLSAWLVRTNRLVSGRDERSEV